MRKLLILLVACSLVLSISVLAEVNTAAADGKWAHFVFTENKNAEDIFGDGGLPAIQNCKDFSSVTTLKKCLGAEHTYTFTFTEDNYFSLNGKAIAKESDAGSNLNLNSATTDVMVTWLYLDNNTLDFSQQNKEYKIKFYHDDDLVVFHATCTDLSNCQPLTPLINTGGVGSDEVNIPFKNNSWNVLIVVVDNDGKKQHAFWYDYTDPSNYMFSQKQSVGIYMFSDPILGSSLTAGTFNGVSAPGSTDGEPYDDNDCQDVSTEENPLVALTTPKWKEGKVNITQLNKGCCPGKKFCVGAYSLEGLPVYCYAPGSIVYDKMDWYCAGNYKTKSNIWVFCDASTKNEVTEDRSYVCDGSKWTTCTEGTLYGDYVCKEGMLVSLGEPEACYVKSIWNNSLCHNPPQPCSDKAGEENNVVIWSYDLPKEAEMFAAGTPPSGQYSCCKPNECANYNQKCNPYDAEYTNGVYICGKDNNWDICGKEVSETKNTPSDGGKYFCDGETWILNENCTDATKDLNGNNLKGCQDPSCQNQIGAYFNSKILDPNNYKENNPTCLTKGKEGCKCEFGTETICNDGFDNNGNSLILNNNWGTDCFDPNCIGEKLNGPNGGICCFKNAEGASCGSDHELHETNCWERGIGGTSGDEDDDNLYNCADSDCNDQLCGGATDRERWRCSNQVCTPPPTAGPAPVIKIMNITFFTYGDLLQFLHKGQVIKGWGDCNSICTKKKMLCGFAQGGRKSCRDGGSTFCTCYPYLTGAEIKEPSKEEQNLAVESGNTSNKVYVPSPALWKSLKIVLKDSSFLKVTSPPNSEPQPLEGAPISPLFNNETQT